MSVVLVTGSAGLVGSETARRFHDLGWDVVGVDNDMRAAFFGPEASTRWMAERLAAELRRYEHHELDVRDEPAVERLVRRLSRSLELVVHAAAQPSHDWAARAPATDFSVNALGTLTLLETVRKHAPHATVLFVSTNKVYGDTPNRLPLVELETRYDLPPEHPWHGGIPETMTIDQSTHSLFGVSKAAADLLVQEYGRYFGLATVTFRPGCVTGSGHSGAELHGFLAYLMRCACTGRPYTVYGYGGKQVRDVIHGSDLAAAFEQVAARPIPGAVYNMGGGREASCSVLEAIECCERVAGKALEWSYDEQGRTGDHAWWISDTSAFSAEYPGWSVRRDLESIVEEIHAARRGHWPVEPAAG